MDRNAIIGLVLMLGLALGYQAYFAPEVEPQSEAIERQTAVEPSTLTTEVQPAQNQNLTTPGTSSASSASSASGPATVDSTLASFTPQTLSLRSDRLEVVFSTQGGAPISATLQDGYTDFWNKEPIQLWAPGSQKITWSHGDNSTEEMAFDVRSVTESHLVLVPRIECDLHAIHYDLIGYNLSTQLVYAGGVRETGFHWHMDGMHNEKGIDWERQHSSVYYREKGRGRSYLYEGREDEAIIEDDPFEWVAFKQNYFSAIVSAPAGFSRGGVISAPPVETDTVVNMRYAADMILPTTMAGDGSSAYLDFYFGPNDLQHLKTTGLEEVGRIIDFGWWIFGWVNRNFIFPLYQFLTGFIGSAGLIVFVLTILIKSLLFPITWKNYLSSAKMRVLRPDIDKINEENEEPMVRQQATMKLYRESGVNPLAGCLPGLLQVPILYAMFRFFPANIELRGRSFLWADDLAAYDSILDLSFTIPMYGAHVSGFTILMAASTFFYTRLTMGNAPQPTQPGMPNMKVMMQIMPVFMLFFFNRFAAGLSLYYLIANLVTISQVLVIKHFFIDEEKIRAKIDSNQATPKGKSKFQSRMDDMQKEQQKRASEMKQQRDKARKKRK